jgi:pyruvate-formate lyase
MAKNTIDDSVEGKDKAEHSLLRGVSVTDNEGVTTTFFKKGLVGCSVGYMNGFKYYRQHLED